MTISGNMYEDAETGIVIVDESQSNLPIHKIVDNFKNLNTSHNPDIASLANWANNATRNLRYKGNWGRDAFLDDHNMFTQFDVAHRAVQKDDVVSGVVESTSSIMMNRVRMNSEDEDQENILNQIVVDMDLVRIIREIWVEMFTVSQCYVGVYWGRKSYSPTNQAERKRKKSVSLVVPQGITVFDPKKVIPWGNSFFRQDKMVYIADDEEGRNFDKVLSGEIQDPMVSQFIVERIDIPRTEQRRIRDEIGEVNLDQAFLMSDKNVFRITATRPDYRRFAEVRMRSVFDLLDLKHQLKAMDRAFLIGGSNMIVVVKKGTDNMPATDPELQALASQVQRASRTPIMVGDHRLSVEIVTPKLDKTLAAERYNAIDSRITSRLYNILSSGNYASGVAADDSTKLMSVIARNLEAKRDDIGRFLVSTMVRELFERNDYFNKPADLNFYPKRIGVALAADVGYLRMIVDMYLSGNISQHSLLEEFDFDYETELRLKEKENEHQEIWHPITPQEERNAEMEKQRMDQDSKLQKQIIDGKVKGGNQQGGGQNPASSDPSPRNQPSRNPGQVDNERRDTDNSSK
jgi:hypothetical protein